MCACPNIATFTLRMLYALLLLPEPDHEVNFGVRTCVRTQL